MPQHRIAWRPTPGEDAATRAIARELSAIRRERAMLDAREARLLAEAMGIAGDQILRSGAPGGDLPARSMAAEFAAMLRESPRTMLARMNEAHLLVEDFPATVDAMADGTLTAGHARAIVAEATHLADTDLLATYEERAIGVAAASTVAQTRTACRGIAESLCPTPTAERHATAFEARSVRLRELPDGLAQLAITGSALLLHGAYDRLTSMAKAVRNEHLPDDAEIDDDRPSEARTLAQLRADLATDLLLTGCPTAHADGTTPLAAIQGTVQVIIDADTITGTAERAAHLSGYGPIDPRLARRLAADAPGWERLFRDPDTGALRTVDRYAPTAAQRRYLHARDEHCRFPGCRQPARRCDIDHIRDHAHGGPTTVTNLQVLCRGHHSLKHHSPWKVKPGPDGELTWISPLGRSYTGTPEPALRFIGFEPLDADANVPF